MRISSFKRLIVTVSYLKPIQIYYRIFYFLRKKLREKLNIKYPLSLKSESVVLTLENSIDSQTCLMNNTFIFLNKSKVFPKTIDWNFNGFGKLWTYNLTYFDYLTQKNMIKEEGVRLIYDFCEKMPKIKDGLEPFPISLRGINWIKFLTRHHIKDKNIDDALYAQYKILMDNLEYHLLGNHLLENGFSLLFGAYYFQNEIFYKRAKEILIKELDEQILDDGGHFELSPMYHQIMLFRVLDSINLLENNIWKDSLLLTMLREKASIMLSWLSNITYHNGAIPLLNDSTNKIAPTSKELYNYASLLGIKEKSLPLNSSGYRKVKADRYECIMDVGNIGPDYIPGHAHSDTFNFELYIDGKAFIVDTGLSTYEVNNVRHEERSTKAHNTVMINNIEQSEVWGGFRVGDRAKIIRLVEKENYISGWHDGYKKKFGLIHQREFFSRENYFKIVDTIHTNKKHKAISYIHFAPDIKVQVKGNIVIAQDVEIVCSTGDIFLSEYEYAPEFNKQIKASVLEISFTTQLNMEIKI